MKGSMGKTKFGDFKPKNIGAEPATVPEAKESKDPGERRAPEVRVETSMPMPDLRSVKVPFSSRITVAAQQQLAALGKEGKSQVDLLSEALNLLFKKYKLSEVA
jgi:hypothetical protein